MGFDLHQLPTKYLFTFLGPDSDGALRRGLEEAWGAPVFDNYGSHEVGLVAWECKHKNHTHINEDTAFIEVCNTEGDRLPDGETDIGRASGREGVCQHGEVRGGDE